VQTSPPAVATVDGCKVSLSFLSFLDFLIHDLFEIYYKYFLSLPTSVCVISMLHNSSSGGPSVDGLAREVTNCCCTVELQWKIGDDIRQYIEACLNSVLGSSHRIRFFCKGKTAADIRLEIGRCADKLHGMQVTVGDNDEVVVFETEQTDELVASAVVVRVKSLALGLLATTRSPQLGIDSHPGNTLVADWISRLGMLRLEQITPIPLNDFKTRLQCTWTQQRMKTCLQDMPSENGFIEYSKLLDNLREVRKDSVENYLTNSFTMCLNSASELNPTAEICFGVDDDTLAFVGLPAVDSVCRLFVKIVSEWACRIFPPIRPEDIELEQIIVEATSPQAWDGCVKMFMSEAEATCALRCLLGYACVSPLDSGHSFRKFIVFADRDMVRQVTALLSGEPDGTEHQESTIPAVFRQRLESFASKCKDSLEWIQRTWTQVYVDEAILSIPPRSCYKLRVRIRTDLCGTIMDPESSNIHVHCYDPVRGSTFELQPWQIWLRAKDVNHGLRGSMRSKLLSNSFVRVLCAYSDEDRSQIRGTLCRYAQDQVQWDHDVTSTESPSKLFNMFKYIPYLMLITTYKSKELCFRFAKSIWTAERGMPSCLLLYEMEETVFESVDDGLKIRSEFTTVEDVVLLSSVDSFPETMSSIGTHFTHVPDCLPANPEGARAWYLGQSRRLGMELVQHNWIVDTENTRAVIRMVRATAFNSVTTLRILKKWAGSGATSMLGRLAWRLQEDLGFKSLFFDKPPEDLNEFWKGFGPGVDYAVLVDDNISLTPDMIERAPKRVRIVIIQIVLSGTRHNLEISPILSDRELTFIIPQFSLFVPEAQPALSLLLQHVQKTTSKEDRHIYAVMHVVVTGKFEPAARFLLRNILNLNSGKMRPMSILLAVMSAYGSGNGIPIDSVPSHGDFLTLKDITVSKGDQVKFLHPFMASIYLQQAVLEGGRADMDISTGEKLWAICESAFETLNLSKAKAGELIKVLFIKRFRRFSPLAHRIYLDGGIGALKRVLSSDIVKLFINGVQAIVDDEDRPEYPHGSEDWVIC
jgi:hypothetical protein